jgi:hypothetical protein
MWLPAECPGIAGCGKIKVVHCSGLICPCNGKSELRVGNLELCRKPPCVSEVGEVEGLFRLCRVLTLDGEKSLGAVELGARRRDFCRHALTGLRKLEIGKACLGLRQVYRALRPQTVEEGDADRDAE